MLRICIGYDASESIAYHVMCQSIIERASGPVSIIPVKQSLLKHCYNRPHDPRQSNEFSFTRFLTPMLVGYDGPVLFADLDMMFREDPYRLLDYYRPDKSVSVVKHDYTPKNETKYMGAVQYKYPRKNWSSVMLFNAGHEHCKRLTPEYVNNAEAAFLHRFQWTDDEHIGSLPLEWNWLVGEYDMSPNAKLVHHTVAGPWFYNHPERVDFGIEWTRMKEKMMYADEWRADSDQLEKEETG